MATLSTQVKGYTKANAKSGAKGLVLLQSCINHMLGESGDWTPLAWLLSGSEGADSTRLRAITNQVVGGVSIKADKKQPTGLRITLGDNAGLTEKSDVLGSLVNGQTSFRSNKVKEELFDVKVNPWDVNKYAASIIKKLAKDDVSVTQLMNAMSKATSK